ncbi:MAG: hypothetical protein J2P50_10150, partial [Hyphomicrobiaceae bacterium]|nr:hypothetical protein [Hyphomicrobiaceae bacterium]
MQELAAQDRHTNPKPAETRSAHSGWGVLLVLAALLAALAIAAALVGRYPISVADLAAALAHRLAGAAQPTQVDTVLFG